MPRTVRGTARSPAIATPPPDDSPEDDARTSRAVWVIAICSGIASLSMSFWMPFVPLYMKELGATSDANALWWMGVAAVAQGIGRFVAGPVWGVLSDRYGRRTMFLRALFSASATMAVAALATEPWHIAAALGLQGLFSGFNPAATALISVTVPDRRLNKSLGTATSAQYIGSTFGPLVGGLLGAVVGYRGAIIGGAVLPALAGIYAMFAVPRDTVGRVERSSIPNAALSSAPELTSFRSLLTIQLVLALLIWFASIAFSQSLRVAAPIVLQQMVGASAVAATVAWAFFAVGVGGVLGVVLAQRFGRPGSLKYLLIGTSVFAGLIHLVLPWMHGAWPFILVFALIAMLQAAMVPATNTLIAANAPRDRRGTAFGLANGMQAIAFAVGPLAAAAFADSFDLGFVILGGIFIALGVMIWIAVREPEL